MASAWISFPVSYTDCSLYILIHRYTRFWKIFVVFWDLDNLTADPKNILIAFYCHNWNTSSYCSSLGNWCPCSAPRIWSSFMLCSVVEEKRSKKHNFIVFSSICNRRRIHIYKGLTIFQVCICRWTKEVKAPAFISRFSHIKIKLQNMSVIQAPITTLHKDLKYAL